MGKLADALSPQSSYAAKKTPIWDEIVDRIDGAILPADLDDLEVWLNLNEMVVPYAWRDHIDELIEKRRDALGEEDISQIMRDRWDF